MNPRKYTQLSLDFLDSEENLKTWWLSRGFCSFKVADFFIISIGTTWKYAELAVRSSSSHWTHGCTDNYHWVIFKLNKTLKLDYFQASSAVSSNVSFPLYSTLAPFTSMPNYLLAVPVSNGPIDVQTTITWLFRQWRKPKNVKILRDALHLSF